MNFFFYENSMCLTVYAVKGLFILSLTLEIKTRPSNQWHNQNDWFRSVLNDLGWIWWKNHEVLQPSDEIFHVTLFDFISIISIGCSNISPQMGQSGVVYDHRVFQMWWHFWKVKKFQRYLHKHHLRVVRIQVRFFV